MHSLSPGFQIAAPSRELARIMSLFHVEKTLLWTVCLNALLKKETVLSIKHIMPGSFYVCSYDGEQYFGVPKYVFVENCDVNIKCLNQNGPAAQFFKPSLECTFLIPIHDIITEVDPPSSGSTGWFSCFDFDEMTSIQKLMWFIWDPFLVGSFKKTNKTVNANKYTLSCIARSFR